jgi:hypothetical protein
VRLEDAASCCGVASGTGGGSGFDAPPAAGSTAGAASRAPRMAAIVRWFLFISLSWI